MHLDPHTLHAFRDELEKTAVFGIKSPATKRLEQAAAGAVAETAKKPGWLERKAHSIGKSFAEGAAEGTTPEKVRSFGGELAEGIAQRGAAVEQTGGHLGRGMGTAGMEAVERSTIPQWAAKTWKRTGRVAKAGAGLAIGAGAAYGAGRIAGAVQRRRRHEEIMKALESNKRLSKQEKERVLTHLAPKEEDHG